MRFLVLLAFCGCVNPQQQTPATFANKAEALPAPLWMFASEQNIRDLAPYEKGVWAATEGTLLLLSASGEVIKRIGPESGLEIGAAQRIFHANQELAIASKRGLFVYRDASLRMLETPDEYPSVRDVTFSGNSVYAVLESFHSSFPALCQNIDTATKVESILYRWKEGTKEQIKTSVEPKWIASTAEGLWLANQTQLFFQKQGKDVFEEILLGQPIRIHRLLVDPKQRLWVLSNRGLLGGSATGGIKVLEGGEFFVGPREAIDLSFAADDTLWVATARSIYSFEKNTWQRFAFTENPSVRFSSITSDEKQTYVGSNRGVFAFQKGEWHPLNRQEKTLSGAIRALSFWRGQLFVGTSPEAGIALSAGGLESALGQEEDQEIKEGFSKEFRKEGPLLELSLPEKIASGSTPKTAIFHPISIKLSATIEHGLFQVDTKSQATRRLNGFDGGVLSLHATEKDGLWASGQRGIWNISPEKNISTPPETNSIGSRSIVSDYKGNQWFALTDASTGRGLGLLVQVQNSAWKRFSTFEGLPANEVYAIAPSQEGLWMAQPTGITGLSEAGVGKTVSFPGPIFSLIPGDEGPWAAGCQQVFHEEKGVWQTYPALPYGAVLAIAIDSKGRVYAGNQSGLYRLNGKVWKYIPGTGGMGVTALTITNNEKGKEILLIGSESSTVLFMKL